MSAIFTIDQATLPAGIPGRARQDIIPGGAVTQFAAVFVPPNHTTYAWEFLAQPPGVALAFSDPTIHNPTVDFGLNYGGYLVRLTVDAGLLTEDVAVLYVGMVWPFSGLAVPALTETQQDNSVAPFTGVRGWEQKIIEYLWWVNTAVGGMPMQQGVVDPNIGPVVGAHIGQLYQDTTMDAFYVCTATGPSVWLLVAANPKIDVGNPHGVRTGVLGQPYQDSATGLVYLCGGGTDWHVI